MKPAKYILLIMVAMMSCSFVAIAQNTDQENLDNRDVKDREELFRKFATPFERSKALLTFDPQLAKPENKKAYDKAAKEAYDFAKEFVRRYSTDVGTQMDVLKRFIRNYENPDPESKNSPLNRLIAEKKYDEAFTLGKQILTKNPNDLMTLATLANAGILSGQTENEANDAATILYSRKAISLVEAGGMIPGKSKEESLAMLYYAVGLSSLKTAPDDSVKAFIQVATLPSSLQKTPQPFYYLAISYQSGEYGKLIETFKTQCSTQEMLATENCKTLQGSLNKVIDRMIDANARVVSLSAANVEFAEIKAEAMKFLPGLYKYRHNGSDEGLNEFVATVVSRELP